MAEPIDMIVPLLREMRAENAANFGKLDQRFHTVARPLQKIEDTLINHSQALRADTFLSRLVTGEFEERIEALERKVRQLEAQE